MNEQLISTYCGRCKVAHRPNEHTKGESWLTTITAGIICLGIIAVITAICVLATNGAC
jgi:hypothetical protein